MNALFKTKRGQIGFGPLAGVISIVFALFIIGIIIFAMVLAGGEMQDATSDPVAIDVINKTTAGAQAYANFSTVLWIITAIGAMLAILFASIGGFLMVSNLSLIHI